MSNEAASQRKPHSCLRFIGAGLFKRKKDGNRSIRKYGFFSNYLGQQLAAQTFFNFRIPNKKMYLIQLETTSK